MEIFRIDISIEEEINNLTRGFEIRFFLFLTLRYSRPLAKYHSLMGARRWEIVDTAIGNTVILGLAKSNSPMHKI